MTEPSSDDLMKDLMQIRKRQKIRLSIHGHDLNDSKPVSSTSSSSPSSSLKDLSGQLKLSEIELKELLKDFKTACDGDGLLDKKQFFSIADSTLSKRFDTTSLPAFHRIYEAFDLDGNGKIDFVELATGMSTLIYGDEKQILKLVFGLFDVNGDGTIEMEEMIDFFKKFFVGQAKMNGYRITASRWNTLEDHLKRIFSATDIDKNGTIEFEEFIQAVNDPDHPLGMLFFHFRQSSGFSE